jgi:O-antigen/teichoic acid export membrane protein
LGFYAAAALVYAPFQLVYSAASAVTYPRLTERYGRDGRGRPLLELATLPTHSMAVLTGFAAGALYLVLPLAFTTFLPEYGPAVGPAGVLIFGLLFYSLLSFPTNTLLAQGRQKLQLGLIIISSCLGVVLIETSLRAGGGIHGVAVATSLAYVANYLLTDIVALRVAEATWREASTHAARVVAGPAAALVIVVAVPRLLASVGVGPTAAVAGTMVVLTAAFAGPALRVLQRLRGHGTRWS